MEARIRSRALIADFTPDAKVLAPGATHASTATTVNAVALMVSGRESSWARKEYWFHQRGESL
jgi:hypothetical protein